MKGSRICLKFVVSLFVFFTCLCAVSLQIQASGTNDYGDFYYYGPIYNSYFNMTDINIREFIHPTNVFCFCYNYRDTQFVCVVVPTDCVSPSPNNSRYLGFYRHIIESDFSGNRVGYNNGEFYQVNYNSTMQIPYSGRTFYIRRATISDGVIYGCPYFSSAIDPSEGIVLAFKAYYDGVMSYSSNGGGSADFSSIESDLSDINLNTGFILNEIQLGLSDVSSLKLYVFMCFMVLCATLFRNIFSQWLRNAVRR